MDGWSCALCRIAISSFDNYLRHLRRIHGDLGHETASSLMQQKKEASRATKQYECSMCDYRGPTKQAIRMHTLRYHRQRSCTEDGGSASRNVLMCPQCSTYTSGTKALIEHARAEHGFQGVVATTRFSDWDEFMAWKEKQERRISASWACYSTCSNNGFTTKYYKCKRSFKRKKVLNPKRKRASTPYQSACTSFLKVVVSETTGKIGVEYCDMHFGHLYNATVSPDSDDDSEPGTTQIFMCNVCPTGACHCMDNVESGISDYMESYVDDGAISGNSNDSDMTDITVEPAMSPSGPETCRQACVEIVERTEKLFDYLSVYTDQLSAQGDSEALHELEKMESGIMTVIQEIAYGKKASKAALLLRRDLAIPPMPYT